MVLTKKEIDTIIEKAFDKWDIDYTPSSYEINIRVSKLTAKAIAKKQLLGEKK